MTRKIDVGIRLGVKDKNNKLIIRPGYKTYFIDKGILGYEDTRIPIISTSSYSDFPAEFVDKDLADALNWMANTRYKIDTDFYDFIDNLLFFKDDKGKAEYFDSLNEYRKYIVSRGDAYERIKAMEWLRKTDSAFSNHVFIDHRARVYERGFIGVQSGETFRPFLNTEKSSILGIDGFYNFRDQVGSFLGGLSDELEGNYNYLSFSGRQKIAEKWWDKMVEVGNLILRNKPNDIRKILEHPLVHMVEGDEQGKFFRLSMEAAKLDSYLKEGLKDPKTAYYKINLKKLDNYKTNLALEQDAQMGIYKPRELLGSPYGTISSQA